MLLLPDLISVAAIKYPGQRQLWGVLWACDDRNIDEYVYVFPLCQSWLNHNKLTRFSGFKTTVCFILYVTWQPGQGDEGLVPILSYLY